MKELKVAIKTLLGKMNVCKVCGHAWNKTDKIRVWCPRCKSVLWQLGHNIPCKCCGTIIMVPAIHHINKDHNDNRINNVHALCSRCHGFVHHRDDSAVSTKHAGFYARVRRYMKEFYGREFKNT